MSAAEGQGTSQSKIALNAVDSLSFNLNSVVGFEANTPLLREKGMSSPAD